MPHEAQEAMQEPAELPPLRQEQSSMGATGLSATGGMAQVIQQQPPVGLDQIGEEGERLPEGYRADGVIALEIFIDMRNIWSVFDLDGRNQVGIADLRTIMRALDIDPSEDELIHITKQIDPKGHGFFTFEKLQEVMEEKLRDIDTPEDLLIQLKMLDRDKDGKIANPEFKQFIMNLG